MTGLSVDHLSTVLTLITSLSFPVDGDLVILSFSLKGVSVKRKLSRLFRVNLNSAMTPN